MPSVSIDRRAVSFLIGECWRTRRSPYFADGAGTGSLLPVAVIGLFARSIISAPLL